jgi:hypothetical protein
MENALSGVDSLKQSYFNILALFLEREKIETRYIKCLLKWGLQLQLTRSDIDNPEKSPEQIKFAYPSDKIARLEAIYHLVQMICLDRVVEDVELEVASIYAEKLGFKRETVGELFKSIATEDYDGTDTHNIRKEVIDFLRIHNY